MENLNTTYIQCNERYGGQLQEKINGKLTWLTPDGHSFATTGYCGTLKDSNGDNISIQEYIDTLEKKNKPKEKTEKKESKPVKKKPVKPTELQEHTKDIKTPGGQYWNNIQSHILKQIADIDINDYDLTEDDAGKLFVDISHLYFRYNSTNNAFMVWTETHWTPDLWKLAERAAVIIGRIFQSKLSTIEIHSLKEAAAFVKRIRSATGIRSIIFFASCDPRIITSQEDYDSNPDLLNTPAGTYDFKNDVMQNHNRNDLITKITRYSPDKNIEPVYFNKFLSDITLNRPELIEALQIYIGSGCSGRTPKDKIAILYGDGSNGKSVLIESVGDCLGDYTKTISIKYFTSSNDNRAAGHTDEIAHTTKGRFCITSENNQQIKLDEAKIKVHTGGDSVPVSFKHGRTFQMRSCFTLFILTNHKPKITGRDTGIWRRVSLFPFEYSIPKSEQDLNFKSKMLQSDGQYIMYWIMQGARKWYKNGWSNFEIIESATDNYKQSEDVIGRFIDECCILDDMLSIAAGKLRSAYERWCESNGEHIFSGRAWREALEEHGLTNKHTRSGKVWNGIYVNEAEN